MRPFSPLLLCGSLVLGCENAELVDPPIDPPPTFVIFGIVEDEAGLPLPGATAELIQRDVTRSSSNDSGYFSFSGVRGVVTLRVSKGGFTSASRVLDVTADVLSRVRLTQVYSDAILVLGTTVTAQVKDPPCDPIGWDANAPCRRFQFSPPAAGRLVVVVTWVGEPELDIVLVTELGGVVATSSGDFGQVRLEAPVSPGTNYEIRVNAYYGQQDFQIRADLIQ